MSLLALVLVLASGFLHAGWNLLGKRRTLTASFFLLANLSGVALLSPLLLTHVDVVQTWPQQMWGWLLLTGFFQALYCTALAGAYRAGDLSIAYPMARSAPILVVMATSVLLGRGDQLSSWCALGACLIVAGCFLIPMHRFSDLRWQNYLNTSCLLALLAAVGTAGYSLVDDEALRFLRGVDNWDASVVERTLVFAGWQAISSSVWLLLFILPRSTSRQTMRHVLRLDCAAAITAGVAMYVTYGLVLIAMAYAKNVSYVVAFRQVSIPIGVGMGVLFLGESLPAPKILGVLVLLVGLVFVAFG